MLTGSMKAMGLAFLESWGYRVVERPEAGDLAVYVGSPEDPKVKHMGIVLADGRIESKSGIEDAAIYRHPIEDIPEQ